MISQMRMNPYLYSTRLSMSLGRLPLRLFAYATSYPHRMLICPIRSALTLGAKASKASFLAFTDGDCIAQPGWLKALAEEINLKSQCKMVLAGIKPIDQGGFTRHFAMLEQSALTVISGGSLIAGIPLMANGANLLLSRQVFEEINGFYPGRKKPSGDDIILLRKVHGRYPNDIAFSFHPKAIMKTKFPSDLPTFWNQRRRWASKTFTMLSKQITAIMMLMFFTQVAMALFLVLIGIGLYNQHPTYALTAVIGLAAKTIIDGIVIVNGAKHVQYPLRLWDFLNADLSGHQCILQPCVGISKYCIQWKRLPLERPKGYH